MMESVRGLAAPPCNSPSLLAPKPYNNLSFSLLFPRKIHQTHFTIFSNTSSVNSFFKERAGLCAFALKKRRNGENSVMEMEDFDDDEIEFDDNEDEYGSEEEGEEDDDDDDDDDEERFVPLENMKKWLENKPRGFGEGKAYDTSVEDKLFDEMEKGKEAQLANINKLKHNPIPPNSKESNNKLQKAPEIIPNGTRVQLFNLPKKKNVHRDLQLAFKGVPGIINIVPAVSGNKKTKDPICKGFAFVDLKSEQDAKRFVQIVSTQNITFGKIQKQIKCEIKSPQSVSAAQEGTAGGKYTNTRLTLPVLKEENYAADLDSPKSSLDSSEEISSNDSDVLDDKPVTTKWEDTREKLESLHVSEPISGKSMEPKIIKSLSDSSSSTSPQQKKARSVKAKLVDTREKLESLNVSEIISGKSMEPKIIKSETDSPSSTSPQPKKIRSVKKKPVVKRKGENIPKLTIPGSANRLRMKEKAVLSGVLSKYAENASAALASRKDS